MTAYGDLLRIPAVRDMFILTLFSRTPMWAANVVLTLHVVGPLDQSYAMAGLVTGVQAVCLGISGPYRGRRLDRLGLRRSILPSLIVVPLCWIVAPWAGYWVLLPLAAIAGLFAVPTFAITRSVLIGNSEVHQRNSAMALDGILSDITYIVGPIIGVALASVLPTSIVLFAFQMCAVAACAAIWVVNPPLHRAGDEAPVPVLEASGRWWRSVVPSWLGPSVIMLLVIGFAGNFTLSGQSLSIVAAMRGWNSTDAVGWALALWGFGSLVGGFVYGILRRPPRAVIMLAALGLSALLVLPSPGIGWFAVLITITGAFSAPVVISVSNEVSRIVPSAHRGEAMSWLGTATILGNALGGPVAGMGLDAHGWQGGMLVAALGGLLIAGIGLWRWRRPRYLNVTSAP
ncbi:MAG: MFS transporter [Microbacterium sp.]